MRTQSKIAVLLLALLPVALHAQTATIYSDLFGGSATALNGKAPDTAPGSETWTASLIANQDGSLIGNGTGGGAVLPVSLAVDKIYTLSMDISLTGTGSSTKYIHFGFADQSTLLAAGGNNAADRFNNTTMNGYPTIVLVSASGTIQATELYNAVVGSTTTDVTTSHNYKMVLDTTGDGSTFKASYYLDGVAFATDQLMDYAPLSAIGGVGFSSRNGTGTVDNFLLTAAPIPEPSTVALLGLGGLALIHRRRRN